MSKFDKLVGLGYSDIFHTISLCTLDIICESALGTNIDAQRTHTAYLDAVFGMKDLVFKRFMKPQFYPSVLFDLFGHGFTQKKWLKILHDFTNQVYSRTEGYLRDSIVGRVAIDDFFSSPHRDLFTSS